MTKKPHGRLLLIVVLLLGIVLIGLVYRYVAIRIERNRFQRAEQRIVQDMKSVTLQSPYSGEEHLEKSCFYQNRKFGRGPRICQITSRVLYHNVNVEQANKIMQRSATYFHGKLSDRIVESNPRLTGSLKFIYQTDEHRYLDYCYREYFYYFEESGEYKAKDFVTITRCGRGAMTNYYPVIAK